MSAYMGWHVGMKVVCVDGRPSTDRRKEVFPAERHVYTIRSISTDEGGLARIMLVEIVNEPMHYRQGFGECWFYARRFRPVQNRTTSIECFRALLNPTEQDKEEIELADFILEHSEVFR